MKTLLLKGREVEGLLEMGEVLEAVRQAYIAFNANMVAQPPIVSIEVPGHNGEMDIKAGYAGNEEIISLKAAVGYWDNPRLYNLPTGLALITLFDARNGFPLCIMDGTQITGYRTGAAGGVSAQVLARKSSGVIGVIGAGNQARMQLLALREVLPLRQVRIWSPDPRETEGYCQEMEPRLGVEVVPCENAEKAVRGADVIVTTTPGKEVLVKKEWVSPGTHIIAIGADMEGKQELDPALFVGAKIVVDSRSQCLERGETQNPLRAGLISPEDLHGEIGEILIGRKPGREREEEITLFDSTGMSVQDITTAAQVYRKALERKIGQEVELISV